MNPGQGFSSSDDQENFGTFPTCSRREIQYPYRTKMTPNSATEKRSIWRPCLTPSNQFLDPPLVCVSDQTKIVNYGPFIVLTTKVT